MRQICAAVLELEATGAAGVIREAVQPPMETPAALGDTPALSPGSNDKAAYKLSTKARAEGSTLEEARDAALRAFHTASSLETIGSARHPGLVQLARVGDISKLIVNEIKSVLLARGTDPKFVPLGQWPKAQAISEFSKIDTLAALKGHQPAVCN